MWASVGIRYARGVEIGRKQVLGQRLRGNAVGQQPLHGLENLRAPAIVERHVEHKATIGLRELHRAAHTLAQSRRKSLTPPESILSR